MCTDIKQKCSRFIQYCSGAAKFTIEGCILRGSDGYKETRIILAELFGHPDVVAEQVIANIRLLALSDELESANRILNQLNIGRKVLKCSKGDALK